MIRQENGMIRFGADRFEGETEYNFEATYYIRYNSAKALFALEQLEFYSQTNKPDCTLCHIYTDLLFEACGSIRNRFRAKDGMRESRKRQIDNNISTYRFSKQSYPLLSTGDFRNYIEHIDERGDKLIELGQFHGTFTIVYRGMDDEIREGICSKTRPQNNTLNLESMTYSILDKTGNGALKPKEINLKKLKWELASIKLIADKQWSLIELESKETKKMRGAV